MNDFKRKRVAAGLNQNDLAKKLGVTDGAISQWERGETSPNASHFPKLAKILGMEPEEVVQLFHPSVTAS